ncbi:MAG: virulence RhuM family protein [Candidatus Margulisbacteria bacterium]|nr:virulence RhuM family protein [Candidatus Margulisiibacteriota bacterium]
MSPEKSNLIMYQTEDGLTKIEVNFDGDTVWLTQEQLSQLFQRDTSVISRHIKNIFAEGELDEKSNLQKMQFANSDKPTYFYSLNVIISVGYRVKSLRGTQFRIWATNLLKEYMQKGFVMNDDLLKQAGGGNYFEELLARIRDIRSSEKVFYRKILDIYATSIDYDPNTETTQAFFATVQNKMHFSAHGYTAAEVIYDRANAQKDFMGLTAWAGMLPRKTDTAFAKNYLTEDEVDTLNRIVTLYLDFAELQAKNKAPMYMKDWISKLDDFLKVSNRKILTHAGKISAEVAKLKADTEYDKFRERTRYTLTPVEQHFLQSLEQTEKKVLAKQKKKHKKE